jgi:type IV secretion system protein VirB10
MSVGEDPLQKASKDIRPLVSSRVGGRGVALFAGVATVAAGLLFYTLESRRALMGVADASLPVASSNNSISSPPALSIPVGPDTYDMNPAYLRTGGAGFARPQAADNKTERRHAAAFRSTESDRLSSSALLQMPDLSSNRAGTTSSGTASPPIIYDVSAARPGMAANGGSPAKTDERVTATWFQNPSTTIPKGTVVQAVLESALDSTRAGFARAIVTRDVFGFDGTQVLIPKGSRLVGEYKADLASGQNRALIQWQRLMRPDGAMINLDSPSADPLGRAGVKGKVNGHFLERFGGAILQSTLDIGVQLATRSVSRDAIILAVPGSVQGVTPIAPDKVQPTLKVRQGTSVSVFVSRDLDFSTVAQ